VRALLAAIVLLVLCGVARAHEVRPAYLELEQTSDDTFDVLWKVPAKGDLRLRLDASLPESCHPLAPRSVHALGGSVVERWTVRCGDGLAGQSVAVEGLDATLTDALVRVHWSDGATQVERLTAESPSFVVRTAPGVLETAGTYLHLGVEHILGGIDHLLFVLALLLLVTTKKRLLWAVTAFTGAHSLTLAAATLGWVHVPQAPVEAVIALSIVFLACEIVHARQGRPGITATRPWIAAFAFGLLHGFGFAGALTEVGLPEQSIPTALLFFNVGVEAGQLLFIGAALVVWAVIRRAAERQPEWVQRVPAYAIGSVAAFWTIQRVAGLTA
jgi:hydrogenase/urease accessory protein HupE